MDYKQIAQKVFYSLTVENETDSDDGVLELLTGDFNDSNYDEIVNCLESIDTPENDVEPLCNAILGAIRNSWDNPENVELNGITVTLKREESEPGFSHSGCDICRDSLGNNVYSCIGYNDATAITKGQYVDIDVCGDCLCTYHNGVN